MPSCVSLSKGRKLNCASSRGGIRSVGFFPWDEATIMSATTGEVTAIPSGITSFYKYELKNEGNLYTENIVKDNEARTTSYDGELALVLQGFSLQDRNEIKMLVMGEVGAIVERYDGKFLVIGNQYGCMVSGGSLVTGTKASGSATNLTLATSEDEPALFLSTAAVTQYKAKVVSL